MDHAAPDTEFNPTALIGACLVPGLGHLLRGERQRAIYICTSILGLFVGGVFLGGIDVIDRREDKVWFFGQALVGPLAFGLDYYHQHHLKVLDPQTRQLRSAYPYEGRNTDATPRVPGTPPNTKSVGRMNELGTLAAALAGMLNLIVILDAGFPTIRPKRRGSAASPATPPSAGGGT